VREGATDKYFILMDDPIAREDEGEAFVLATEPRRVVRVQRLLRAHEREVRPHAQFRNSHPETER